MIDFEGERDLLPELLAAIPAYKRLISWHGHSLDARELSARLEQLSTVRARLYKLVLTAAKVGDALIPLRLLQNLWPGILPSACADAIERSLNHGLEWV